MKTKTANSPKWAGILTALTLLVLAAVFFAVTASAEAAPDLTVTIDTGSEVTLTDGDGDGFYEIADADDLYAFAAAVNGGNSGINGELTRDITVNADVLLDDGTLSGENADFRTWIPIAALAAPRSYGGTFEGGGYTVKGLYFNDALANAVGLFGELGSQATVRNVTLSDCYFQGQDDVGGIVGDSAGGTVEGCRVLDVTVLGVENVGGIAGHTSGTVTGCYAGAGVSGTVSVGGIVGKNTYSSDSIAVELSVHGGTVTFKEGAVSSTQCKLGGIVGHNYGNVYNCLNEGTVTNGTTKWYVGGIVGLSASGKIANCVSVGKVSSESSSYAGALAGGGASYMENCYYLTGSATGGYRVLKGVDNADYQGTAEGKAASVFASGEMVSLLGENWGQSLDNGSEVDAYPVLANGENAVYMRYQCGGDFDRYTNDPEYADSRAPHGEDDGDGKCSVCGGYLPAPLVTEENYMTLGLTKNHVSYYAISEARHLFWLAEEVNLGGNGAVNAVLVADITLNEKVLEEDGTLVADNAGLVKWTPIGTDKTPFTGAFDGGTHTIRGLFVFDTAGIDVGLFGVVYNGTVRGVKIKDTYFETRVSLMDLGGIVGYISGGTVQNCTFQGVLKSSGSGLGGIVGRSSSSTVSDCQATVTISGTASDTGGIVGYNNKGTVSNCQVAGTVRSSDTNVGGIVGNNGNGGSVVNCQNAATVTGNNHNVGGIAGYISSGTVQSCVNLGDVTGKGGTAGGIVGWLNPGQYASDKILEKCVNKGAVSGGERIGGIVGLCTWGVVRYCVNEGSVTTTGADSGGIAAASNNGTFTSCYTVGAITGTTGVGGIVGTVVGTITAEDCYYLTGNASGAIAGADVAGKAEAKSPEAFASGEVAYLLGVAFGQTIGTDPYPVFDGATVYENTYCDGTPFLYANSPQEDVVHKENAYGYCPCEVKLLGASITVGKDLTVKYYAKLYDEALLGEGEMLAMRFTMNDRTVTVLSEEELRNGDEYVFLFENVAPQQMADLIDAVLTVVNEEGETVRTLAEERGYSVKENAEKLLSLYPEDTALVQLVTDLLTYGAAAQEYLDYNLENLANADLETAPSESLPGRSDLTLGESLSDTAYFKSVTVWFDNVNRIGVRLSTREGVTLRVNGREVALDGDVYYTDAVLATEFDTLTTFELYEGDTLVQSLTYSVSSYVYAMMDQTDGEGNLTEMAVLARALYRYGASAVAYVGVPV